jgi:chemotaxis protein methyltransferase CheR
LSAGCCTGEEPYTIAMMVMNSQAFEGWNVKIFATDINRKFLEKAKVGIYSEWSFRGIDAGIKEKYFTKLDRSKYEIIPAIKQMVDFSYMNLIEDPFPLLFDGDKAIDLVLCRNVLMYFAPEYIRNVIKKFSQTLRPDGWLLVSPAEVPLIENVDFSRVFHVGAILNRKTKEKPLKLRVPILLKSIPNKRVFTPSVKAVEPGMTIQQAKDMFEKSDYEGTISVLVALAKCNDVGIPEFMLLSRSYANIGMLADAEKWSVRAIGSNKASAESQYLLALIKIEQNLTNEAIQILRKTICLDPDFVVGHFMLAALYRNKQNYEKSDQYLKNAMRSLQVLRSDMVVPGSEGIKAADFSDLIAAFRPDGRTNGRCRATQRS